MDEKPLFRCPQCGYALPFKGFMWHGQRWLGFGKPGFRVYIEDGLPETMVDDLLDLIECVKSIRESNRLDDLSDQEWRELVARNPGFVRLREEILRESLEIPP